MGRRLAAEYPVEADLVIPVPESGTPAAIGYARSIRNPLRPGARQERLRRAHLHPAVPDAAAARHQAQAEPARARHQGQAADRRRRLDRARQHPARARGDVARGRRRRGARAHLEPADQVALLLRHRLRHPGRALATGLAVDEVRQSIGADTLGYLSEDGMIAATDQPRRAPLHRVLHGQISDCDPGCAAARPDAPAGCGGRRMRPRPGRGPRRSALRRRQPAGPCGAAGRRSISATRVAEVTGTTLPSTRGLLRRSRLRERLLRSLRSVAPASVSKAVPEE